MKKIFALILALLMAVSVCACSSSEGEIQQTDIAGFTATEGDGFWGPAVHLKDNSKTKFSDETATVSVEETELDTVIFDNTGITVNAKKLSYEEFYGPVVTFETDNFSGNNISIESTLVTVNGCVFPATFYSEVPAYESAEGVLYLYESELSNLKISDICKIEIKLNIKNTDTNETVEETKLTQIYYSDSLDTSEIVSRGDELISDSGVTLYIEDIKKNDTDAYDYIASVFVANNSDKNITVSAEDVTINDIEIDPNCIINVPANSSAYHELSFYKSTLKENNIEEIESIILTFLAYDSSTYESITASERFMIVIEDY